ncbi:MAG: hypothetical protein JWQ25_2608 [Daejeonella sp.]|nr:hypothetical protein [Daejeonella sp.]
MEDILRDLKTLRQEVLKTAIRENSAQIDFQFYLKTILIDSTFIFLVSGFGVMAK